MFRAQSISTQFLVAACVAILMLTCAVMAQDNALRKDFEALYTKRDKAFKGKDADFINSLLAEDYTSKDNDGKLMNRAQTVEKNNSAFAAIKEVISVVTKIESVRQGKDGSEAVVETSDAVKLSFTGADGQPHLYDGAEKLRETWVLAEAGWKLKYTELLESKATIDGKPMK